MKFNHLLFLFIGLISFFANAQQFTISGKLIDGSTQTPLEAATVFAETLKDSTLITYTITDSNGDFVLKGRTSLDKVNLYVSFVGYQPYEQIIDISTNKDITVPNIALDFRVETLGDVIVKGRSAPVSIKKDTLEFNVSSFQTKKDATVEDLLRELPGVEVDEQGNITVNGKPVNQILVNGKPFFGDDPTIATRNLTKDIIDKIQVTDTKTKSEAFTGEAGDDQNKSINITIDEEKNKGIFGRVAAGAGTDERFEYAGLVNYFDNDLRISALGSGNNINSPGFSFGEIEKMFGNARYISVSDNGSFNINGRSFGGNSGITNSRNAGFNYADNWSENTEASADYFYSGSNSFEEELSSRENILPDNRYFSNSSSTRVNNNDSHAVNGRVEKKIDSTFFIEYRPQFNYNEGDFRSERTEETRNADGEISNQSATASNSLRSGRNFENDLSLTRKYGANGAFVRLRLNGEINDNNTDSYLNSTTQIYGDDPETIERDQFTDGKQAITSYDIQGEWRIPLVAKKLFVNLQYSLNNEHRKDRQSTYDFDENSLDYTNFNLSQSTDFTNNNRSSRPEIGMNYRSENTNASFDVGYVMRTLKSDDALRDINFDSDFDAIELRANLWHKFNQKWSMWSGYNLNNDAPGVRQLSPYVDVSDPLNTIQGNPDLSPENRHSLYMGVNNYDFQSRAGFNSYFNANITNDRVISRTTVDENFVRTTTYANVDGNYNIYSRASFSKNIEIDTLRTLKYEFSMNVNANRNVNFNNDVQYASKTIAYSPGLGLRFTWKKLFEIRPEYTVEITRNSYNLDLFDDREFLRHEVRLRTTTFWPKELEWNNDIRYYYNPNLAGAFQKSSVFWNSSIAYSVMQDKGLITFKVYDLLNQNTNARRTATQDYIQDVQSTVLQQYFMLNFSYKFNTLGKKGEVRENNWFD
ncbi:outer membrane beta-barrel protein [Leeuwenhoekiella sp. A2]|uniref:outer membrane beta-barrel protein n=1 Tax=Leeuwenhoekiella sp. A2 TaxID=3141460 RepID=UPI003A800155